MAEIGSKVILSWGNNTAQQTWVFSVNKAGSYGTPGAIRVGVGGSRIIGSTVVRDGRWHHVAAVLPEGCSSAGDIELYVDGRREDVSHCTPNTIATGQGNNVHIGKHYEFGYNFYGAIDDVRIYRRQLSADEIAELGHNDQLVNHWKLDSANGSVVWDAEEGNDGILANGAVVTNVAGEYVTGIGAVKLDGSDDYVEFDGYEGIVGSAARTCAAWIRAVPGRDANYSIMSWGNDDTGSSWYVFLNGSISRGNMGAVRLAVVGGTITGTRDLRDNAWHHVAVVLPNDGTADVSEALLYVDGSLETTTYEDSGEIYTGNTTGGLSRSDVLLGKFYRDGYPYYFEGMIDDVRIYSRALSDVEVLEISGVEPDARWEFDDEGGLIAVDSTSNGHDGTLGEGMDTTACWADGVFGRSLYFDGNGYVTIPGYKGVTSTASRTCMAWIKTEYSGVIATWGNDHQAGKRWRFCTTTDTSVRLSVDVLGGSATGTTDIGDGRWHHVAAVLKDDGSPNCDEIELYIDGIKEESPTYLSRSIETASGTDVLIGSNEYGLNNFEGHIDDVRVYDFALSASQIKAFAVQRPELEAYWPFDEGEGSTAKNVGTAGEDVGFYDGILQGMESEDWVDGISGGALQFGGTSDPDYVEITGYKGILGSASRTCTAWIRAPNTDNSFHVIMSWGNDDVGGGSWKIVLDDDDTSSHAGALRLLTASGSITGTRNLRDGNWHHVAVVLADDGSADVSEAVLYVDGLKEAISNVTAGAVDTGTDAGGLAANNVFIGACYDSSQRQPFEGFIDEVRIYNVALGAAEIRQLCGTGGGIYGDGATGTISKCIIRGNHTDLFGGGIYGFDGTVSNCVIHGNTALKTGGGLANCDGTIQNSIIAENAAYIGGGLDNCQGNIVNCTVVSNMAVLAGGMYDCATAIDTDVPAGRIINCIVWNNNVWDDLGEDIVNCANVTYSSVGYAVNTDLAGSGNISEYPLIDCDVNKDVYDRYRLQMGSPCINAGDPGYTAQPDEEDVHGGDRPYGSTTVDIGASEYQADNLRIVGQDYTTIQAAITQANSGDVVVILPGTYTGTGNYNVDFAGKAITVTSINPDDPAIVAATIIVSVQADLAKSSG